MTAHLLQITVGPVQEFIAQARRTRDLWYGSHLLSELSRAVARSLHRDPRAVLIFPALGRKKANAALIGGGSITPDTTVPLDLEPCVTPFYPKDHPVKDDAGKPPISIANIILAVVEGAGEAELKGLVENARQDLMGFWHAEVAAPIRRDCNDLIATVREIDDVWTEQLDSLVEFTAAWSELAIKSGDTEGNPYKATRNRLNKAIAARKNLRDFEPWQHPRDGVPKSSLDGARVSVLKDHKVEKRPAKLVKKYRLNENEQLDAVGLVKRGGGTDAEDRKKEDEHDLQFVPIVNVALAPWIACAMRNQVEFQAAIEAIQAIKPKWPRVKRNIACGSKLFNTNPQKPGDRVDGFDASIFLRSRWWPEFKELEIWKKKDERAWRADVINWGNANIGPLLTRMSEPHPYVACLVADGDGMGAAIDALGSAEEHSAFSHELAKFARAARKIVESDEHLGSLVYSGGDDVLAFLPVSTALACADALRKKFADILGPALGKAGVKELPTLSVGIGIGHVMESMGDHLELGRRAEKLAKGGSLKVKEHRRNALAIIVDKRSGGTREWRSQWSRHHDQSIVELDPAGRLKSDMRLLGRLEDTGKAGKHLSVRKVHQIAAILRRLPDAKACTREELVSFDRALAAEVKRALARSDGDGERLKPEDVGLSLARGGYADTRDAVSKCIDRVMIARALAESEPKSRP